MQKRTEKKKIKSTARNHIDQSRGQCLRPCAYYTSNDMDTCFFLQLFHTRRTTGTPTRIPVLNALLIHLNRL